MAERRFDFFTVRQQIRRREWNGNLDSERDRLWNCLQCVLCKRDQRHDHRHAHRRFDLLRLERRVQRYWRLLFFRYDAAKTVTANFSTGTFSLGTALDNNNLAWATGGNASFTPQTTTFYSGGSAAQTGSIGNSQSTHLSTSVTGPGTLSFYWKVSSEEDYDIFSVYLDGVKKYSWSGYSSWNRIDLTIPTGTHTVKWQYVKDKSDATGEDAGWVDYVVFTSSTQSGSDEVLYYPHIAANAIWQTEVAIINTSDQTVSGTLKAFTMAVIL